MKHLCIFTQSPLTKAPRVVKEANTYAEHGYRVTVFALWYDQNLLDSDRKLLHPKIEYKPGINLLNWKNLTSRWIRLKRKIGRELVKHLNVESKLALGYDYNNYLIKMLAENADFYIGHEEMSMALAKDLIENGRKVAFDFEDWHSKDLLPKDRAYRPTRLLEKLEKYVLANAAYCYTTSEAMANAMAEFYNVDVPNVIYNSFKASDRAHIDRKFKDKPNNDIPSLYWFSQVISPGRGLELLFDALPLTKTPFQLHLRGHIDNSYKKELQQKTPAHVKVVFQGFVPHSELISRVAEHDLGLAIEESQPESRNCTVTNKVFHYLQAGIPILATETKGQCEISEKSGKAVAIVRPNSQLLAQHIDKIFSDSELLSEMRKLSWDMGGTIFSFESQEQKLLDFIKKM